MTDKEFLKDYDVNDYKRPSVAFDIVILALDKNFELNVLLVDRDQPPFQGLRQLPGGFVAIDKELDDCVVSKVKEKTGLTVNSFEQIRTYGKVDRDPRTRVISIAYYAILSQLSVEYTNSYLAKGAYWKPVKTLIDSEFAFDHFYILLDSLTRLRNKLSYTDIAFDFLKRKNEFTLFELNKIYSAILDEKIGLANFRRDFMTRYKNKLIEKSYKSTEFSKRPSTVYELIK